MVLALRRENVTFVPRCSENFWIFWMHSWIIFVSIKVGLGISRTNTDSQWNPVTTHFIDLFVLETKQFVSSFLNVIYTRQTCRQRSSMAAESKHRALGHYFPGQSCHMFLKSKCRWDQDLGLCTTSGLAFGESHCNGKIQFFQTRFFPWSRRQGTVFTNTGKTWAVYAGRKLLRQRTR